MGEMIALTASQKQEGICFSASPTFRLGVHSLAFLWKVKCGLRQHAVETKGILPTAKIPRRVVYWLCNNHHYFI